MADKILNPIDQMLIRQRELHGRVGSFFKRIYFTNTIGGSKFIKVIASASYKDRWKCLSLLNKILETRSSKFEIAFKVLLDVLGSSDNNIDFQDIMSFLEGFKANCY